MKSSKTTTTVPVHMTPAQIAALVTLADALEDTDAERVAGRVFSLGLFVLGLDRSGDYALHEITDALHGKGSDAAATLFNAIVTAGDSTRDEIENAERERRKQTAATHASA